MRWFGRSWFWFIAFSGAGNRLVDSIRRWRALGVRVLVTGVAYEEGQNIALNASLLCAKYRGARKGSTRKQVSSWIAGVHILRGSIRITAKVFRCSCPREDGLTLLFTSAITPACLHRRLFNYRSNALESMTFSRLTEPPHKRPLPTRFEDAQDWRVRFVESSW